jgi:hypothetical protein
MTEKFVTVAFYQLRSRRPRKEKSGLTYDSPSVDCGKETAPVNKDRGCLKTHQFAISVENQEK